MNKGFTLIELMVVFAIIGILTVVGIASYTTYNSTQTLNTSIADVTNVLTNAKSRAISQVKTPECTGRTLNGYQITITPSSTLYTMSVVCGGITYVQQSRNLPQGVTFGGASAPSILFNVSTGTVTASRSATISGYGRTRTINVDTTGNIRVY